MAKKGFKLPAPTPLKQTAGNSFFRDLPMRPYVSTGSYANPQTYFGESSLGSDVVSTIGNTFADSINAAASSQNQDSSVDTDVSGSDLTIDPTGQLPSKTTTNPGLERGSKPKLEKRIAKAEAKGNLKKAARLKAKQDRNITRQTEGEKRIEERQDRKNERVTNRQEGLTRDFEDRSFAGRMLSSIGNIVRKPTPPDRDLSQKQTFVTALTPSGVVEPNVEIEAPIIMKKESPLDFMPSQQMGQPQAFSYDVPMQANMMGTAKPLFNQQTMGMAEAAFGNPAMRQASVGAPFQSNAFYAALNDAKEKGAKTFEVGGKTFDVK